MLFLNKRTIHILRTFYRERNAVFLFKDANGVEVNEETFKTAHGMTTTEMMSELDRLMKQVDNTEKDMKNPTLEELYNNRSKNVTP